ncbi:type II secretion system protein GspG [Methylocystis heyeri]|uniref:Type II secretion system core protein G n=2 Tax=Methylocystis heyeri TaxID=391905 RepID=A0A6B8KGR6_9HYPH|nr:type II secretion system protein GspG [Methylocystis heyeri]
MARSHSMTQAVFTNLSYKRRVRLARRGARSGAGFTLIEMLVVLGIIGLIVGLVGPRVLNYLSDAKVKTAQIQIENIASSLDLFYLDTGRYPNTEEGLGALVQRPHDASAWNGPYLKSNSVPKDPWGHAYIYRAPGQNGPYDIGSVGPEGRDGGKVTVSRNRDAAH